MRGVGRESESITVVYGPGGLRILGARVSGFHVQGIGIRSLGVEGFLLLSGSGIANELQSPRDLKAPSPKSQKAPKSSNPFSVL